ncbi:hypothetical protein BBF93_06895 [Hyphomonas sp. CACIAM 19H1]|nr:hypothetical protein BBF93_06895 [Hyphomonas sp. CACIAM 19H1]
MQLYQVLVLLLLPGRAVIFIFGALSFAALEIFIPSNTKIILAMTHARDAFDAIFCGPFGSSGINMSSQGHFTFFDTDCDVRRIEGPIVRKPVADVFANSVIRSLIVFGALSSMALVPVAAFVQIGRRTCRQDNAITAAAIPVTSAAFLVKPARCGPPLVGIVIGHVGPVCAVPVATVLAVGPGAVSSGAVKVVRLGVLEAAAGFIFFPQITVFVSFIGVGVTGLMCLPRLI